MGMLRGHNVAYMPGKGVLRGLNVAHVLGGHNVAHVPGEGVLGGHNAAHVIARGSNVVHVMWPTMLYCQRDVYNEVGEVGM